ncbi:MAG: rRNA maturation RNase YbeY [Bacteroidales bacterium]
MAVKIYYRNVKFRLGKTKGIKDWIEEVIRMEEKEPGDLSFIFIDDKEILKINREFLKHDYYTDVIAFDYHRGNIIEGEVFLSIDTIRRNSALFSKSLKDEILRVMVHAALHLVGYNDDDKKRKDIMREAEDKYLGIFKSSAYGL